MTITSLPAIRASPRRWRRRPTQPERRLTIDEAVRLAIDNNLGIQIARLQPQVQDLAVAARALGVGAELHDGRPGCQHGDAEQRLPIGRHHRRTKDDDGRMLSNVGLIQQTPWGGSYSVGWDSVRSTTTNVFSSFSPQIQSSLSIDIRQPLLRNFAIDNLRQQVILSEKDRESADFQLQQTIATTSRAVRNAYWDLGYANASLAVQQQSLDLANESLRETNARIQIGTTPPIDAVEAQAEVAARQEAVIVAEAQIETAEDNLRTLVFNPSSPDFWTTADCADRNARIPTEHRRRGSSRAQRPAEAYRPAAGAQVARVRRHQHQVLPQSGPAGRHRNL
jgi:hypothetical protein